MSEFNIERLTSVEHTSTNNAEELRELKIELAEFKQNVNPQLSRIGKVESSHILGLVGSIATAVMVVGALFVAPLKIETQAIKEDLIEHKSLEVHQGYNTISIKVGEITSKIDEINRRIDRVLTRAEQQCKTIDKERE